MNPEALAARSAIESLRSGVPSRHAVAQLGTTQLDIESRFRTALTATAAGQPSEPIAIAANFGAGKSHLLEYLQTVAEAQGFVTSFVVISPEMPLGNAHVVLKAVAEAARAPGRVGKGLRALAGDPTAAPSDLGPLRYWATNAGIDERFHALLLLYEQFRADEELRSEIHGDFEGKPLMKSVIKAKLREIGRLSSYALQVTPRNALLAHDRLRLLAQFFRASGGHGIVVFFDELERVAKFSVKQRIAVYQELGWWRSMAEQPESGILPVFAMTDAFLGGSVTGGTNDQQRFATSQGGASTDERDHLALRPLPRFSHPRRRGRDQAPRPDPLRTRLWSLRRPPATGAQRRPHLHPLRDPSLDHPMGPAALLPRIRLPNHHRRHRLRPIADRRGRARR
jgi:hypothetical protein